LIAFVDEAHQHLLDPLAVRLHRCRPILLEQEAVDFCCVLHLTHHF